VKYCKVLSPETKTSFSTVVTCNATLNKGIQIDFERCLLTHDVLSTHFGLQARN